MISGARSLQRVDLTPSQNKKGYISMAVSLNQRFIFCGDNIKDVNTKMTGSATIIVIDIQPVFQGRSFESAKFEHFEVATQNKSSITSIRTFKFDKTEFVVSIGDSSILEIFEFKEKPKPNLGQTI